MVELAQTGRTNPGGRAELNRMPIATEASADYSVAPTSWRGNVGRRGFLTECTGHHPGGREAAIRCGARFGEAHSSRMLRCGSVHLRIFAFVATLCVGSCSLEEAGQASAPGQGGTAAGGSGATGLTGGAGGFAGGAFGGGSGGMVGGGGGRLPDATGDDSEAGDAAEDGVIGDASAESGDSGTGGATGWKPSEIANCVLWLDAADAASVLLSNSLVQSWQDKCGATPVTSAGVAKPVYLPALLNGMAGVRFDGADDVLEVGGTPKDASAYVLFFVLSNASGLSSALPVWSNRQAPAGAGGTVTYFGLSAQRLFVYQNTAVQPMLLGTTSLGPQARLVEFAVNPAGRQLAVGGTVDSSDAAVIGTVTKLPTGLLGSDKPNNEFAAVDLFEVVFYDRELTAVERNTVRSALKSKWALP